MIDDNDMALMRIEMRKLTDPIQEEVTALQEGVTSLGNTVEASASANYAGITNVIDNSLPEWSQAAYMGTSPLPADPGDGNLECYNFYRQLGTDTELLKSTIEALKAPKTIEPAEHSLFVANEGANADIPRWDKINGTMTLGGAVDWDLHCPLPSDIVFPGQTFNFQVEAKLASGSLPTGVQFFAALYDNTAGQRKVIEGGPFTITGATFGTPNPTSSTPAQYMILAKTDSGEQVISNLLTIADAPAVFTGANHPRIDFAGVAGFIEFLIYRYYGGVYVLQYTVGNTIEGTYHDIGNPPQAVVPGWPAVTTQTPRAYALTSNFSPNTAFWVRYSFTIFVPTTYNRGLTGSGMQYLLFGLTGPPTASRQVLIRRIGLSQGDGTWSRSPNDLRAGAHSTPSTSAIGAGGGTSDGGGGIDPPPPPGTGDPPICVLGDSMIDIAAGGQMELRLLSREYLDGGGAVYGRVRAVKMSHASRIYRIKTQDGLEIGCSTTHRFITHPEDYNGTPASALKKKLDAGGDVWTLTKRGTRVKPSRIVSMEEESGDFMVGTPRLDGCHIYIANGFLSHNIKHFFGL